MTAGRGTEGPVALPGILEDVSEQERQLHREFLFRHIDMVVDVLLAEQVASGDELPLGCPTATSIRLARRRKNSESYPCCTGRVSISQHLSVNDSPCRCGDPLADGSNPLDVVVATSIAPDHDSLCSRYFDRPWWETVSDLRSQAGSWQTIAALGRESLETELEEAGFPGDVATAADRVIEILDRVADRERIDDLDLADLIGLPYSSIIDFLTDLPGVTERDSWWLLLVAFDRPVWPADRRIDAQLCSLGLLDPGDLNTGCNRRNQMADELSDRQIPQLHRTLAVHAASAGADHCEDCEADRFYLTHRAREQRSHREGRVVVDLFSGAGGLSAGFRDAGHQIELAVDHNRDATDTFRLNHPELPHDRVLCADITDLGRDELGDRLDADVDIVVGGPPCQALSVAGYRSRKSDDDDYSVLDDDRTALYTRYVDMIRELDPDLLVMENVEGLISEVGDTGIRVADQVLEALEDEGYLCDYRLLDCTKFGIPQERERVVILGGSTDVVGSREEIDEWFDRLVDEAPDEEYTLRHGLSGIPLIGRGDGGNVVVGGRPGRRSDYVEGNTLDEGTSLFFNHRAREHPMEKDRLLFDEAMEPGDTGWDIKYNSDYGDLVEYDVGTRENPRFKDKYRMLKWDCPSPTIVAHLAKDSNSFVLPDYYEHVSDSSIPPSRDRNRGITPREAARLQSFPDDYIFLGSFTSWFRQIGNAVPPVLGRHIGEFCDTVLEQANLTPDSTATSSSREAEVGDD